MENKGIKKYLLILIIIVLAYIAYLVAAPFIKALLTSLVLSYLFYPVYKKIASLTKNETFSAAITTILIVLIILIPLISIANSLVSESINLYKTGVINQTKEQISTYIGKEQTFTGITDEAIAKIVTYLKNQATAFLSNLAGKLFDFLITIYATFYFLIAGPDLLNKIRNLIPSKQKDAIIIHIKEATNSIVYGLFVTAIVEFIIALIVFKIIGSSVSLLLALTIGFFAFIPFLGPGVVWVPYSLILLSRQETGSAIAVIVMGVLFFIIETFVRPKIIGKSSKIHPLIILIGTIGGIKVLGFIGLIMGPIILSTIITLIKEYYPEIKDET